MAEVGLKIIIDAEGNVAGVEQMDTALNGVEGRARDAQAELKKVGQAGDRLMKTGAMMGAAVVGSLVATTKAAADYGDEIAKAAGKTGMTTEAISGLRYAAEQSGVAFGNLEMGLARMQRSAVMAAEGGNRTAEVYQRLGVNVRDSAGNIKSGDVLFTELAQAISEVQNPTERAALAMEIFGRSGAQMLPLFKDGAAGIAELTDRAEQLGLILDAESAAAAERFNDSLSDLKMGAMAISNSLAQSLFPALSQNNEAIAEALGGVSKWIGDNRTLTRTLLMVAGGLGTAAMGVYAANKAFGMVRETVGAVRIVLEWYRSRVLQNTAAVQAETTALGVNTAAANANAAAHRRAGGARGIRGVGAAAKAAPSAAAVAGRALETRSTAAQAGYGAGSVAAGAAGGAAVGALFGGVGAAPGALIGASGAAVVGTGRMAYSAGSEMLRGRRVRRDVEGHQEMLAGMSSSERREYIAQQQREPVTVNVRIGDQELREISRDEATQVIEYSARD